MARHYGPRLRQFKESGHDVLALENELVRVEVLVSKGADIVSFLHKPTDTDFLWRSSLGVLPPSMTIGRGFLDAYEGGWQEVFPNGGSSTTVLGASLPFHGEVSTVPWRLQVWEDSPELVEIELSVRTIRTPYLLERRMRLASGRPCCT